MKILTNRKIKLLFLRIGCCIMLYLLFVTAATLIGMRESGISAAAIYTPLCAFGMGIGILAVCYGYFKEQNRLMEDAVVRIREFISGDRDARIECNEEGELYRLFHEINSLAAILNAQAEKEGKSRKFLQNTISDISHQLKTPLAALDIYNGIIQTEAGANDLPTIREFSDLSEKELDRIETLVQNLLKITKFDAGTMVMERKPENISEIMEDVKNHFSFRAEQEGKEIVLSGDTSLSFSCDRNWMTEAISNIVKNALDYTENGDSVRIEWGESASAVRIVIKDNGSGIYPEDLHHIFKRFYRSRYSRNLLDSRNLPDSRNLLDSVDRQGIGLGLPLAKSVVEAHNGTIEVDSTLGEGTTFVIFFLNTTKL